MKFALFFLGEYSHMITTSFLVVILFFGGWHCRGVATPGPDTAGTIVLKLIVFVGQDVPVHLSFTCWCAGRCRASASTS